MTSRLPVLFFAGICGALPCAQAQFAWIGAGSNGLASTRANWLNSDVPAGSGDEDIDFGDVSGSQFDILIPASLAFRNIGIGGDARPAYSFGSSSSETPAILTLNGHVSVGDGENVTFLRGLTLALADGEHRVDISGEAKLRVSGDIMGTRALLGSTLVKTGGGTLALLGNSVHLGNVTINAGKLFGLELDFLNDADIVVGAEAGDYGTLSLQGGTVTAANLIVGRDANSTGTVNLDGTALTVGDVYLGQGGTGLMTLTGGATVDATTTVVGAAEDSSGALTISGGTWHTFDRFTLGRDRYSAGNVVVTGSESQLQSDGASFVVGHAGSGTLELSDGGRLEVNDGTGSVTLGATADGSGTLLIGGRADAPGMEELFYWTPTAKAGGILNAAEVTTGAGTGTLQFLTNSTSENPYRFTKTGTADGDAIVVSGSTQVINARGHTVLSGAHTYTGGTLITGGTLAIDGSNVLPTSGSVTLDATSADATAALFLNGATQAIGALTFRGEEATINQVDLGRAGRLVATGDVGVDTTYQPGGASIVGGTLELDGQRTFEVGDSANATVELAIDSTVTGTNAGIVKSGGGTLALNAGNSYDGGTTILGGKLIASHSFALGSGMVLIDGGDLSASQGARLGNAIGFGQNGGRIGGNGAFDSAILAGSNVTLSPGDSPGTTTFYGALTWAPGGSYDFEIVSAAGEPGTSYDTIFIAAGGTFDITANANGRFNLNLISLNAPDVGGALADFDSSSAYSWQIASSVDPLTGFSADAFSIDTTRFANDLGGGIFSVSLGGSNREIYLNFAPVPEPSTYVLMAAGAGLLFLTCRRRKA